MDDVNLVEMLIQGGSVGVAVVTLGVLFQLVRIGAKILDNHLNHITEVLTMVCERLDQLIRLAEGRRG